MNYSPVHEHRTGNRGMNYTRFDSPVPGIRDVQIRRVPADWTPKATNIDRLLTDRVGGFWVLTKRGTIYASSYRVRAYGTLTGFDDRVVFHALEGLGVVTSYEVLLHMEWVSRCERAHNLRNWEAKVEGGAYSGAWEIRNFMDGWERRLGLTFTAAMRRAMDGAARKAVRALEEYEAIIAEYAKEKADVEAK